jgi:hypothetical protein
MSHRAALLRLALTVTIIMLLGACTGAPTPVSSRSSTPTAPLTADPTPLAAYDTTAVAVSRAPFCDRVSPTGIEHALGGIAKKHDQWEDGDQVPVGDRGHEYGCAWSRRGATAQAWVFAPPLTRAQARQDVGSAVGGSCQRLPEQPSFGKPGVAVSCGHGVVRFAGLFGDAWLTCELDLSAAGQLAPVDLAPVELAQRAGEWCVTVLEAARA